MIWLISIPLICLAGYARFLEGSDKSTRPFGIENGVLIAAIGACASVTAYVHSSEIVGAFIVGCNAAICISYGGTSWSDIKHQFHRGLVYALPPIIYLYASGTPFVWLNVLGICTCFTVAYVVYCLEGRVKPPFCEMEVLARWVQGFSVCLAGILL